MNLNKTTALALRIGVAIGIAIVLIGLITEMTGHGDHVLYIGILVLIFSPFMGVLASFASLVSEKDWHWAAVALVLILITVAGIVLSFR